MDRTKHLALADEAMIRAERLADHAENAAHSNDNRHKAAPFAAAGALWADIARSHAAIADAQLVEDTSEAPTHG
ncbi:hypothetical protein [Streptomyces sp. NPDC094149]|uniref:hypothetical protein n=1 Tax=Streptomyces sp. NPDC094149 TaxID=3155079 RepID=UPI00332A9A18